MDTPYSFKFLHIFTVSGKTFTFKDGTVITDNESTLGFSYIAGSNGKAKTAVFIKANLAGHAVMMA